MGLFSKRSKSRSKGSGATSATDDYPSQGSQGKLAASPHSLDGADFQGNGVNSGVYSVDDDQDGNAKGGTGNWVDQAANAADMGSQVFPNTADKYLGFGSGMSCLEKYLNPQYCRYCRIFPFPAAVPSEVVAAPSLLVRRYSMGTSCHMQERSSPIISSDELRGGSLVLMSTYLGHV